MSLAINLEIFRNALTSIAEEMGANLQRAAYSPNIKERRDFSCALFDNEGRLSAQAAHIPVHLGSMPLLIKLIKDKFSFHQGDLIIANDPFSGGTHLPDITLVEPIFYKKKLWGFSASRAHHSDIGGMSAGSMPNSTEVFQEGIIIPPMLLKKQYKFNHQLLEIITANTRTPNLRMGDIFAQLASLETARERIRHLIYKYGFENSLEMTAQLMDYSERLTKAEIGKIPQGNYTAADYMEDDNDNSLLPIKVMVIIDEGYITVDFTGTSSQKAVCFNAPIPVTLASVYYTFRCLLGDHIPQNDGCFRPIKVKAPLGCLVNAQKPYATAGGNVETSQRIVDTLLLALSQALPEKIPAASCGSMNNITIGGIRGADSYAYYETIGGGMGAGPHKEGLSALHTHMTNTRNTPIECLESEYPFMITRYEIRQNSGGSGKHRGGDGILREYLFNCPSQVSIISERRRNSPYGLSRGKPGAKGINSHFDCSKGSETILPGKTAFKVNQGDKVRIETPGGGGFGGRTKEEMPAKRKERTETVITSLLGGFVKTLKGET